jgi:acyl-CoA synthetase (NDP forming)
LRPRRIAVFGASSDTSKVGGKVIRHLLKHGFRGEILPINPRHDVVQSLPAWNALPAHASADVAIICLPAGQVAPALEQCVHARVGAAVVLSAGFGEAGEAGRTLQTGLQAITAGTRTRLLGPNCLGFASLRERAIGSFSSVFDTTLPRPGTLAIVAQSGAIGASMLATIREEGLGLGWWVTTGNEADLSWLEIAELLIEEPGVEHLMVYAESIRNASRLLALGARAAMLQKPIIVVRPGNSNLAQAAAMSHTGVMANNALLAHGVSRQAGLLEVRDLPEMIGAHRALLASRPWRGAGIGVISTSGGLGIMLVDACAEGQLPIAELSDATRAEVKRLLPAFAGTANPVDVTGASMYDREVMIRVFEEVERDPNVGAIVLALTFVTGNAAALLAADIARAVRVSAKPTMVVWLAGEMASEGYRILREANVPLYHSVTGAASALSVLFRDACNRRRLRLLSQTKTIGGAKRRAIVPRTACGPVVTETPAKRLLASYGVAVTKGERVDSAAEAVGVARRLGYPIVVKSESESFLHRFKRGGVVLDVNNEDELRAAYRSVTNAARVSGASDVSRCRVETMVSAKGLEFIVGGRGDAAFGPCVVLGLGGNNAELINDTVARRSPVTRHDAEEMIDELRSGRAVRAWLEQHGQVDALAQAVVRLSELLSDLGQELVEMDVNPLLVPAAGDPVALDALLILCDEKA